MYCSEVIEEERLQIGFSSVLDFFSLSGVTDSLNYMYFVENSDYEKSITDTCILISSGQWANAFPESSCFASNTIL